MSRRPLRTKNRPQLSRSAKAVATVVVTVPTGMSAVATAVVVTEELIAAVVIAVIAVIAVVAASAVTSAPRAKVAVRVVRRGVTVPSAANVARAPSVKEANAEVNATASSARRGKAAKVVAKVTERTAAKAGVKDVRRAAIVHRVMTAENAMIAVRGVTKTVRLQTQNETRLHLKQSTSTNASPM